MCCPEVPSRVLQDAVCALLRGEAEGGNLASPESYAFVGLDDC